MIGHVYRIIHLDSDICYVGSTINTTRARWQQHKSVYKDWLNDKEKYSTIAIYPYIEKYGFDRFRMILIKSYNVYDKKHLRAMEQLAINKFTCVNTICALSLIGVNSMSKHYDKYRYLNNREKKLEQSKIYRETHKQSISDWKKSYYLQNKQSIKEQRSVKVTCDCGSIICKAALSRHKKSAKCITALVAQTN